MTRPLSNSTIVERTVSDQVVTRSELKRDANRISVQRDLGGYLNLMDQHLDQMTSTASDAYARAKTVYQQDPANNQPAALQILTHPELDPTSLPTWAQNFNFGVAATATRAMLLAQGNTPESIDGGEVTKLLFEDADLTFLNSSTPTLLIKKGTEADDEPTYLRYPENAPEELRGRVILLGGRPDRDTGKELAELKILYPQIDWPSYATDFREFGSFSEILRTQVIPGDITRLRRSDADPASRDFVITARSAGPTWIYLDERLRQEGIDIDGVFAVNTKKVTNDIIQGAAVSSAQKKALTMAAIIQTYGADKVKNVEFRDDTDANVAAAMQLLPKMFPQIRFKFFDVVHQGENKFAERLVAFTNGMNGELIDDQTMKRLSLEKSRAYVSGDAPFPIDPIFRPLHTPA